MLEARRRFPHFGDIYDEFLKSTGKMASKVNNIIFTSLRSKPKKVVPQVPTQKENYVEESKGDDENTEESGSESESESESGSVPELESHFDYDYNIGRNTKQVVKMEPVGKNATPGWYKCIVLITKNRMLLN